MGIYKPGRPSKYHPATCTGTKPPHAPGEYRICTAYGAILYIGETNDLYRRMLEHIRSGKLLPAYVFEFQIADGRSTSNTRRQHERMKIAQHRPPVNRSSGGEGRPAGKSSTFISSVIFNFIN